MNNLGFDYLDNQELELTGDTGWISKPLVKLPLELTIQLKKLAHISYIEFLVHPQYIPQQLLVSNFVDGEFDALGTVTFKPRESQDGKQEQKKVLLSCYASVIKLSFLNLYDSDLNPESRIGITSMSIYGRDSVTPSKSTLYGNTSSTISIYKPKLPDDFDGTVSSIGSNRSGRARGNRNRQKPSNAAVDELKGYLKQAQSTINEAVAAENFSLAKRMQTNKAQLELVVKQLQEANKQKIEAINNEDYDRAQELVDQMNSLKTNALANVDTSFINISDPIPSTPAIPKAETPQRASPSLPLPRIEPVPLTPSTVSIPQTRSPPRETNLLLPPITPASTLNSSLNSQNSIFRPYQRTRRYSDPTNYNRHRNDDNKSLASTWSFNYRPGQILDNNMNVANNRFLEKENRPIRPAKNVISDQNGQSLDDLNLDQLLDMVSPSDRTYVTRAVNIFGIKPVAEIYSKNFKDRRNGLKKVQDNIDTSSGNARDVIRAAIPLLIRGLSDKIYRVYDAAIGLNEVMLNYVSYRNQDNEISRLADLTTPILISRTGDTVTDQRFASRTFEFTESLFKKDIRIATDYLNKFSQPLKPNQSVRTSRGQSQIVSTGVESLIVHRNRLNIPSIITFALGCIDHSDGEVRRHGRDILMTLYKSGDRKEVRDALTKDTVEYERSRGLRNLLEMFDQQDRDDGLTVTVKSPSIRNGSRANGRGNSVRRATTSGPNARTNATSDGRRNATSRGRNTLNANIATPNRSTSSRSSSKSRKSNNDSSIRNTATSQTRLSTRTPSRRQSKSSNSRRSTTSRHSKRSQDRSIQSNDSRPQDRPSRDSRLQNRSIKSSQSNTSNKSIKSIVRPATATNVEPKSVKIQLDGSKLSDTGTTDYSKVCMYCGVQNNSLNLTGLEAHYKKECPMLTECSHCKDVVETRHLRDHLIHECSNKANYKQCDRCQQAVLGNLYTKHRSSSKCRLLPENTGRCPLCYEDVKPDNDIGWRDHLMKNCKANKRK